MGKCKALETALSNELLSSRKKYTICRGTARSARVKCAIVSRRTASVHTGMAADSCVLTSSSLTISKPISKPGGAPAIETKKEHVYSASTMAGRFSATTVDAKGRLVGAIVPVVLNPCRTYARGICVVGSACGFGHSITPGVFLVD